MNNTLWTKLGYKLFVLTDMADDTTLINRGNRITH